MNIFAIVQARIGSTRLRGKVLMDISSRPMVWHVIDRLRTAKRITDVILAIPDTQENDVLADFAKNNQIKYFRGDENNVLSRYYAAAKEFNVDIVVRVTSDCPMIDPQIVDQVVEACLLPGVDFSSNFINRLFPRGADAEAFYFSALEKVWQEARETYQREHVTPYIYENPQLFKIQSVEPKDELRNPDLRLTVDTQPDLDLAREIYKRLYIPGEIFSIEEVIALLDKEPQLKEINKEIKQKPFRP
ncbi:MAG: glycosyltransferase family protein [bacterium]